MGAFCRDADCRRAIASGQKGDEGQLPRRDVGEVVLEAPLVTGRPGRCFGIQTCLEPVELGPAALDPLQQLLLRKFALAHRANQRNWWQLVRGFAELRGCEPYNTRLTRRSGTWTTRRGPRPSS